MRKFILIASMLAVAGFVACSSDESDDGAAGAAGTGGATGGTGGGVTGGSAGEAGNAGAAGTGGGGGQDCSTCGQAECPDEVAACVGATGCLQCLQGDDTACSTDNEDEVAALGECLMTNCADECAGGGGLDCDAPAVAATGGSCITLGGNNACNPVTNEGCDATAGEACDANDSGGYGCFPAPNTQGLCEECNDTVGYCQGGMTCGGQCARVCCDDTDCSAAGTCDKTLGLPGGVGVCVAN